MPTEQTTRPPGRPEATSREEIERVAFDLFAEHGFEGTTLDMIASELGVARRTLFSYFGSKNDIPWGAFDESLAAYEGLLDALPEDLSTWEAVHRGVIAFNDFDATVLAMHRNRMRLILTTPALQAHSALRYTAWREVIARFVAGRSAMQPDGLYPQTVGHVSLALALAAYEAWLRTPEATLTEVLDESMELLRSHLA